MKFDRFRDEGSKMQEKNTWNFIESNIKLEKCNENRWNLIESEIKLQKCNLCLFLRAFRCRSCRASYPAVARHGQASNYAILGLGAPGGILPVVYDATHPGTCGTANWYKPIGTSQRGTIRHASTAAGDQRATDFGGCPQEDNTLEHLFFCFPLVRSFRSRADPLEGARQCRKENQ